MQIAWGDKNFNLQSLRKAVADIHPGTDLLVLPEMFSTGFLTADKEQIREFAERNTGETVDLLKEHAASSGVAIAGSYIAETGGQLFNRAFFVDSFGEASFADKRHLFSMAGENKIFTAGDTRLKVRYRGWNIAMVICYDIRFPVWCRNKNNDYDLLLAVANWPVSRVEAWTHLLKARAIENLAYVAGVNCQGTDNKGYKYDGSSRFFDYIGREIGVRAPDAPFLYASLSYNKLQDFRNKFPAYNDADKFSIIID